MATRYYAKSSFNATLQGADESEKLSAGNYYVLSTKDGMTEISKFESGGSSYFVKSSDFTNVAREGYDYYNLEIPTDGYFGLAEADKKNASQATKLNAGTYYLVNQSGNFVKLSKDPDGKNSFWINTRDGAGTTTHSESNVDPSNTNTVSGYQNPSSKTVYKKNMKLAPLIGENHYNSYIKNLVTGNVVEFDLPKGISENMQMDFETTPIRGRSVPFHGYSSTGDRSISITIPLHADYCKEDFDVTIDKLRALNYPGYSNNVQHPQCLIRLGNFFCDICVVQSVSITYPDDGTFRDGKMTYAEVSLEFFWAPQNIPSVSDIERGAGREFSSYA